MKRDIAGEVIKLLEEFDSLTALEMSLILEIEKCAVSESVSNMRRKTKKRSKLVYIKSWTREGEVGRYYPRPKYALGNKQCRVRPKKLTHTEKNERYRKRLKNRQINSVFMLGASVNAHVLLNRERLLKKSIGSRVCPNDSVAGNP